MILKWVYSDKVRKWSIGVKRRQTLTTEAKYCVCDSRAIEDESMLGGIGRSTFSISFWILLVYSELKSTVGSDSISPPVYKLKNICSHNSTVCLLMEFSHKLRFLRPKCCENINKC